MTRKSLFQHITAYTAPTYYAPFDKARPASLAHEPEGMYQCRHIESTLVQAFPAQARAWMAIRKQVNYRAYTRPGTLDKLSLRPEWFHRATGLAQFILAIGRPEEPDMELHKRPRRDNDYTEGAYTWKAPSEPSYRARDNDELAKRYYAIRTNAARSGRSFAWDHFDAFAADVGYPQGVTQGQLHQWRLRWRSAALEGYHKGNFYWERVRNPPLSRTERAPEHPWNKPVEAELERQRIIEQWESLDLPLSAHTELSVNFGLYLNDAGDLQPPHLFVEGELNRLTRDNEQKENER